MCWAPWRETTSIGSPSPSARSARPAIASRPGSTVTPPRPRAKRRSSRPDAGSQIAHQALGAPATRAHAATTITSGPNAPTQHQRFSGRPPRTSGIRSGGSGRAGRSGPGPRQGSASSIAGMLPHRALTDESVRPRRRRETTVRAAAVQLTSTADRERNLATADRLTRAAAASGAQLVVLPEKWAVLGTPEETAAGAEPFDGPALAWAAATARELGIDLVAGSIAERVEGREKGANTSAHFGPDGELRAVYRKIHMFDVEVGGRAYRESEHEEPGDDAVLSEAADGTELGLTVCYDLRFPELYRLLAVRGARVFTVAAAFTLTTTREHWEVLLRARAIEDQAYVVAANQVGEHAPGLRSGGRSMIVDPWGVVLAQAPDAETFVVADLDLDRQEDIRRTLPSLANRRLEAFV
jgi:predicted amidohydrolase